MSNQSLAETTGAFDANELQDAVSSALEHARSLGAESAEAGVSAQQGLSLTVRLGEVETVEHHRDRTMSVTVYNGQRRGNASCGDIRTASIKDTVAQAWAIATHTEPDEAAGLAAADQMATVFHELDLWHPEDVSVNDLIERALSMEQAGRDVDSRIINSEGASISTSEAMSVYGNSHGFRGMQRGTNYSQNAILVAAEKHTPEAMQRDYAWDSQRQFASLQQPEITGQQAAEKTIRRLGASTIKTTQAPVLFVPETARTLLQHLLSAVSGGALYRKASFLLDQVGQSIFPDFMQINEDPHQRCGVSSSSFDNDGVVTGQHNTLIENGVLQRYVLSTYAARRLGLSDTANAGGVRNLKVQPGSASFDDLVAQMGTGLIVTDLMGQGINTVTGDYSRGAGGFWVENGVIVQPVEEVTIAANLSDMFANIIALGNDVDTRTNEHTPSWLLSPVTIAGS